MFGRLSPHSLQIGLLLRQLHHSQSGSVTPKVSILMLAMMAMFDALSTVFHVSLSILIQDLFSAFLTIVFFSVLIFAVLELKYMAIIMTGRAPDQSPERTRQEVRFARYLHRTAPHRPTTELILFDCHRRNETISHQKCSCRRSHFSTLGSMACSGALCSSFTNSREPASVYFFSPCLWHRFGSLKSSSMS